MDQMIQTLAAELHVKPEHAQAVVALLDEGNTVPFIARYRKEQHGAMDDQTIRALADRLDYLRGLAARKGEVKASIQEQGNLTPRTGAGHRERRHPGGGGGPVPALPAQGRTRASMAKEKGLEPLAQLLFAGKDPEGHWLRARARRTWHSPTSPRRRGWRLWRRPSRGRGTSSPKPSPMTRPSASGLREKLQRTGSLRSAAATEEDTVYRLYYDFTEPLRRLQSHQVLAVNRGEKEGFLKVSVEPGDWDGPVLILREAAHPKHPYQALLREVAEDAWARLIFPSLEREIRSDLTDMANEQAIHTFALNLRPLLLQPPVKNQVTLGFDPAYRTGCKLAVVDGTGKVLETGVIYPTKPHNKVEEGKRVLRRLCDKHGVTCIAIGNGTASRESEIFVSQFLKEYDRPVSYMVVSEAGASVYSASKLGAEEFPDYDVSPALGGVHCPQAPGPPGGAGEKSTPRPSAWASTSTTCPRPGSPRPWTGWWRTASNAVGVDVNTASPSLLRRVAGMTPHRGQERGGLPGGKRQLPQPERAPKSPQAGS